MEKCKICNIEFKNNSGGQLTNHIIIEHNITIEDYYVLYIFNKVEPKCACGYCNERPNFRRGKFSKYAIGHNKFDWIEMKYIEKNGAAICNNPACSNLVKFHRGKPNRYCSPSCIENNWNQIKVRNTVKNKYGVDNVFQLDETKIKLKNTMIQKYGVESPLLNHDILLEMKKNNVTKYGVDHPMKLQSTKNKIKDVMMKNYGVNHFSKTDKFREIVSKNMCNYNLNIFTNHKIRYYKETKLYYQSQYEYRFLELSEKLGLLDMLDNSHTFKYEDKTLGKWHLPDFIFDKKYVIEIKSTYWMNRQGGIDRIKYKKESVEILGYKYIFILDENYDEFYDVLQNGAIDIHK